jgi:hypothetical protein
MNDFNACCCRCLNPIDQGYYTIFKSSIYCMDCYPEIMPKKFKMVVADLAEERGD